jgi:hypothetical protein
MRLHTQTAYNPIEEEIAETSEDEEDRQEKCKRCQIKQKHTAPLGDAAVSSSNIISGGDLPERRARKVVNYAEADKEVDRQIRRHVNYVEFGKGKGNVSDSDDDQPRRKRVTRGPAADVEV